MKIPDHVKHTFETIKLAAANGDLVLMVVFDSLTNRSEVALCAKSVDDDDGTYMLTPVALISNTHENPYDRLLPPDSATPDQYAMPDKE